MSISPARRAGRRAIRILIGAVVVLTLVVVGFVTWAHIVMPGDRGAALRAWRDPGISISSTDHSVILRPVGTDTATGLVFIPGAKVDPYAYLYKLSGIAERGVTVVITKPILNLAFFDQRPLSTFTSDVPGVTRWFVGGHSLGGVRACMLAESSASSGTANPDVVGLVLFGSYCANDLSHSRLTVLSIGGTRDGLSTPAKINAGKHLLPADSTFIEIRGGNHARFGDYGRQPGDNAATISSTQARTEITRALVNAVT